MSDLPGSPPPTPAWGQEPALVTCELKRRIRLDPTAFTQVAIVHGAGGAFAPDLLHALILRGYSAVIGCDVQLTYLVEGVTYRDLDLRDPDAVTSFYDHVMAWASERGLTLGPTWDISAVQTNPRADTDRISLGNGKEAMIGWLARHGGRLFAMSTAEVYGAPEGAPYTEAHDKLPFNAYARAKWAEEQEIMAHTSDLPIVALRTWTIAMVAVDEQDEIVACRNYNDPLVMIAERLSRARVRLPISEPEALCVFHISAEVAEVAVLLGSASADAPTWGNAFNCIGQPATHGTLRDVCYDTFQETEGNRPWWGPLAWLTLGHGRLPGPLLRFAANTLERGGGLLGARDMASRLPFLWRSTHLDTSALQDALGDRLTTPAGSATGDAVRRMCVGIREGGPDALAIRRYRMY